MELNIEQLKKVVEQMEDLQMRHPKSRIRWSLKNGVCAYFPVPKDFFHSTLPPLQNSLQKALRREAIGVDPYSGTGIGGICKEDNGVA